MTIISLFSLGQREQICTFNVNKLEMVRSFPFFSQQEGPKLLNGAPSWQELSSYLPWERKSMSHLILFAHWICQLLLSPHCPCSRVFYCFPKQFPSYLFCSRKGTLLGGEYIIWDDKKAGVPGVPPAFTWSSGYVQGLLVLMHTGMKGTKFNLLVPLLWDVPRPPASEKLITILLCFGRTLDQVKRKYR